MANSNLGQHGQQYLTIREVGEYIGISFRTLEGWKRNGYLPPHIALTRKVHKWRRADIDAWLALKQRDLLDDWLDKRGELGAVKAWAMMLGRLQGGAL